MQDKNFKIKEQLKEFMGKALCNYDLPGLALSVGVEPKSSSPHCGLEFARGAGAVDFTEPGAVTESSIFHMASVTKLFVGTSIMQLWERGSVDLDEKLVHYLPWFSMADPRFGKITIRQLLSHTAGMPDVTDYGWDRPEIDEGALARYARSKEVSEAHLLWEPGEGGFAYSNIGYELLGTVISEIAGMPFEDYVEKNIFMPLHMKDSTLLTFMRCSSEENRKGSLDLEELKKAGVCMPHTKDKEKKIIKEAHFPYNRAHGPSSTLTANMPDLSRFAKAHLRGELLKTGSYEEAWREQGVVPNNGEHICLSWFKREQNGFVLYGHEGTDDGFRVSFWICPELGMHIAASANISGAPVKKISKQVFNLLTEV